MATTTPRPAIEALDVPLADVQADIKRRRVTPEAVREALQEVQARHKGDKEYPAKERAATAGALWLVEHPECCSTAADYPDWTCGGTA
ncbi:MULTISPECIES: hypothetical protein [Streptomyces]|uniref:Uncharacterized protein n=2 Tax=Streptomyces rimosus subsp. rimosus TaxID=132474 RepID=L8EY90_STRR1|nr:MULTISPECIES: hypothetical protein [Streptomyces]KOG70569.1 hypothetical protein ADK78_28720 [Kitasatospora aureofaciens]MYT47355.1 hypothetical protein [Streptomyces sp. SID5471]KEF04685.1 hypothetical protein DF17_22620 [Streptomyces rimosus]KEF19903.1 hypothetical protein DF18_13750 [Streptomyces rimosus]KOT31393.1 hypothetical protein ADK84_30235 [Streptomyces sp. NRRL WC-3701]